MLRPPVTENAFCMLKSHCEQVSPTFSRAYSERDQELSVMLCRCKLSHQAR